MSARVVVPIGVIVIAVIVLGSVVAFGRSSPQAPSRGYSAFLDDVAHGEVDLVVQEGQFLSVREGRAVYSVVVPSVVTNVYFDMQLAAEQTNQSLRPDIYSAVVPPDTSWIGLVLTAVVPLVVILGFISLMLRAAQRAPQPFSARSRLAQLEDARRAGQLTAEEYATKREEIIRAL